MKKVNYNNLNKLKTIGTEEGVIVGVNIKKISSRPHKRFKSNIVNKWGIFIHVLQPNGTQLDIVFKYKKEIINILNDYSKNVAWENSIDLLNIFKILNIDEWVNIINTKIWYKLDTNNDIVCIISNNESCDEFIKIDNIEFNGCVPSYFDILEK